MKQKLSLTITIPTNPNKKTIEDISKTIEIEVLKQRLVFMEKTFIDFCWIEKDKTRDKHEICAAGREIILPILVKSGILKSYGWESIIGFRDHYLVNSFNAGVYLHFDDFKTITDKMTREVNPHGL